MARGGASEQQIRHVDAGNQKDQRDEPHQYFQWRRELVPQVRAARRGGGQVDVCMPDIFEFLARGFGRGIALLNTAEDQVGLCLGLLFTNRSVQAGDDVQRLEQVLFAPVPGRRDLLLHGERNPEIGRLSNCYAEEFARGHSDNDVIGRPDVHGSSDGRAILCQAALPPGVAGDRNRVCAGCLVVSIAECAAENRIHAESIEVAAGDEFDVQFFEVGGMRHASMGREGLAADGGDFREDAALTTEFAIERVREELHISARQDVVTAGGMHSAEKHPLLRLADGKVAEHERIQQAENGGIGSNTERQSQNGGDGKDAIAAQSAGGVAQVAPEGGEQRELAAVAAFFFDGLDAAQRDACSPARLFRRNARADVVFREHFEVSVEFQCELVVLVLPYEGSVEPGP